MRKRSLHRISKGLLTYLIIIPAITFALLEATLRAYDAISPSFVFPDNSGNRWRGKPHSYHYDFQLNSGGFVDIEYEHDKPDSTYRIVALGDSFLYGVVPYENNFLTLLDDMLDDDEQDVEVINMGIPDTAPRQYHALFVNEALAYNPDLVLVHIFIGNDFQLSEKPKSYARYLFKVLLNLIPEYEGVARSRDRTYDDNSPTMSEERFAKIQKQRIGVLDPQNQEFRTRIERGLDYIEQIAEIAETRNIKLIVVLIPDVMQIDEELLSEISDQGKHTALDVHHPNNIIRERLEENGIDVIDLLPDMLDSAQRNLYKPYDTHWNIAGNQVAAAIIAREINIRALFW